MTARFVPLKLHLFESPREVVRPLNVIWTPTLLIADRRMTVHYRSLNYLPPRHFLTMLDLGEAELCLRWSRTEQAITLLEQAEVRADGEQSDARLLQEAFQADSHRRHRGDDLKGDRHGLQDRRGQGAGDLRLDR